VNDTTKLVRGIEMYNKRLNGICFTVALSKSGTVTVRLGKKYSVAVAPNKGTAEIFCETLNLAINRERERISAVLEHIAARCEQLNFLDNLKKADDVGYEPKVETGVFEKTGLQ
jgi:hypothetical protein